jgi:aminoglycoside phosphotransferase (APT) family kinase protein
MASVKTTDAADEAIIGFIRAAGLALPGAEVSLARLTGGVSSDIWLARTGDAAFCVKRALPKLRVAADWFAPVERNANEAAWFRTVGAFMPEAVPEILAEDAKAGVFAMQYLPGDMYANWKAQLRDGIVSTDVAGEVGRRLVRIHSVTSRMPGLPQRFASDAIFHAIRLEPYLLATAEAHPDLAGELRALAGVTARAKHALVHGDVSPKNILIGPRGPVFLDAECAWWGDPAFDLAFCLNHLLLKCLWVPAAEAALLAAFDALAAGYRAGVDWEPGWEFEARTSRLLPGLFLARIDGKSPVEYVTDDAEKDRVRRAAAGLLRDPADRLAAVAEAWRRELHGREGA